MASMTTRRAFVVGAAAASLLPCPAIAQARFPSRVVKIVIGFPPGGGIDILARLMAPKMAERLGQSVIVENRPGANGLIATVTLSCSARRATSRSIRRSTRASPGSTWSATLQPCRRSPRSASCWLANPSVPAKSLQELIDLAKAKPGEISFGSSGNGGLPHLSGELLNLQAGIRTLHVPYRGSAPAFTDLISGQVQFVFDALAIAQPHIEAGKLRALATTGPNRMAALPDVPLMKDTLPDFEVLNWYGMVVPAGTPADAITRLHQEVAHAVRAPDVAERAAALGLDLVGSQPNAFAAFQKTEIAKWGKVIRTAKIQVQ